MKKVSSPCPRCGGGTIPQDPVACSECNGTGKVSAEPDGVLKVIEDIEKKRIEEEACRTKPHIPKQDNKKVSAKPVCEFCGKDIVKGEERKHLFSVCMPSHPFKPVSVVEPKDDSVPDSLSLLRERAEFEIDEGIYVEFNQGVLLACDLFKEILDAKIQELEAEKNRTQTGDAHGDQIWFSRVVAIKVLRGLLEDGDKK